MSRDANLALKAKRRDGMECVKCGRSGSSSSLHAHHIIPRSHGGSDEIDNLATLCRPCHRYAPDDRLPKKEYRPLFAAYKRTGQRPEMDLFQFGMMMDDVSEENLEQLYQGRFAPSTPPGYWLLFAACAGYNFVSGIVSQCEFSPPASERGGGAIEERIERGDDLGRPPFGLQYDDAGRNWVPDRESGEFGTALEVIRLREDDHSWRDIADKTGEARSTVRAIYVRRERYLEEAEKDAAIRN